ncbi:hypothetical protein WKW77_20220 [Variovorax ureilyticus]|uniref:Uncharacterized protein n=1 Tax=Variovorax ureilyticus TaxID=1836198 RepID=A0ABU8VKJ4_9BURK
MAIDNVAEGVAAGRPCGVTFTGDGAGALVGFALDATLYYLDVIE